MADVAHSDENVLIHGIREEFAGKYGRIEGNDTLKILYGYKEKF